MDALVVAALAVAVGVALWGERSADRRLVVIAKPLASLCFLTLGVVRAGSAGAAGLWLLAGLVFCAAGDVLLIFPRAFLPGLVAFLLGHGAYVAAFASLLTPGSWPAGTLAAVALASTLAVVWLWPHLDHLRAPVVAYVAVLSVMLWGAAGVVGAGLGPWRLALGALLFYLSDLAVARHRFVAPGLVNRLWGMPLYYLGQVLIASSIS